LSSTVSIGFCKPSSRSLGIVMPAAEYLLSEDDLLGGQPNGRLRAFCSAVFHDDDHVATAFRDAGGTVVVRTREGQFPTVRWIVKDRKPTLSLAHSKKGTKVELKLLIEEATWQ